MFMDKDIDLKLKRLFYIIAWLVLAIMSVFVLIQMQVVLMKILNVLSPFILAGILAYIFNPIVNFLQEKLHLGRVMGIIVFAIILIIVFVLFFGIIIPIIYNQAVDLFSTLKDQIPQIIEKMSTKFGDEFSQSTNINFIKSKIDKLGINLKGIFESIAPHLKTAAEGSLSAAGTVTKGLFSGVKFIISLGALLAFSGIITFYILLDTGKIKEIIKVFTPDSKEDRLFDILKKIDQSLSGFLHGQLIVCSIIGILTAVGLFFIGLKQYALLIGFVAGAVNIIPYLGPITGAAPAILWALFTSQYVSLQERLLGVGLIIGLFSLIQAIDGFFISPKIIGKTSKLHPLVVMLALIIGAQFGFIGLVLAVPAACVVKVLFIELLWKKLVDIENKNKVAKRI